MVLEKNFNIHEVIIQTLFPITEKQTSCSQRKTSFHKHQKGGRVRHISTRLRQYEIVLSFKVSLFILFIQS